MLRIVVQFISILVESANFLATWQRHKIWIFLISTAKPKPATRLKFETRSYQEMVINQMRQMSEDNQQLIWFKDKVAKEQRRSKALAESFEVEAEKLRKTVEENRIVWQRSKMHHEQNKQEMDFQEQFFIDQLQVIHKAREDSARGAREGETIKCTCF